MRYELTDNEWTAIRPMLPNKPRGVPRVNDRRVLNGIFWVLPRHGAPDRAKTWRSRQGNRRGRLGRGQGSDRLDLDRVRAAGAAVSGDDHIVGYPRIFAMMLNAGHSPGSAWQIIAMALLGDPLAVNWIRTLRSLRHLERCVENLFDQGRRR